MYLHFEDWSAPMFLDKLEQEGLPHTDKIIKVFASVQDPSAALGRPGLTVVDVDEAAFSAAEAYEYPDRGSFTGDELEEALAAFNLGELGCSTVRSLFRFSNQHGFCQAAMAAPTEAGWLIDHPFGDIDGIEAARRRSEREIGIHLDIFFPESLMVLGGIVDYTRPDTMLTMKEGHQWRKQIVACNNESISSKGRATSPERANLRRAIGTILGNGFTLTHHDVGEIAPYYGYTSGHAKTMMSGYATKRAIEEVVGIDLVGEYYVGTLIYRDGSIDPDQTDLAKTKAIIQERRQRSTSE